MLQLCITAKVVAKGMRLEQAPVGFDPPQEVGALQKRHGALPRDIKITWVVQEGKNIKKAERRLVQKKSL